MADFSHITLHEARDLLRAGALSSVELTEELLKAAVARDGAIHAYLSLDPEDARAQARAADLRRREGGTAGLLGLPVGIKDVLNVRGQPCTCGSRMLESYCAPYDATVITRLKAAGALCVGRMNMDEFAMGSTTENSAYGPTRNPWNPDRAPGGSSGGSAAAVSARTALATLGTDTGGSIRQPAAFCGCVGLKPTYGRVSRYGLVAFASSLDQIGPLTRCVRDAAILLGVIAGRDPMDSTSMDLPIPDYERALDSGADGLRGLRIGIPREYFTEGMDPAVEASVRAALRQCEALGAIPVEITLPRTPYAVATYYVIATAEASANLARFDGVRYGLRVPGPDPIEQYGRTRAAGFGPEVKRRIILGTYALSSGYHDAYYVKAQKARTLIRRDFEEAFRRCDLIAAPVAPTAAYRLGEHIEDPIHLYLNDILTIPVNLAGICGLSVPCGFTPDGLPVGLQMIGPAFGEERILRAAHAYEQSTEWHRRISPAAGGGGAAP